MAYALTHSLTFSTLINQLRFRESMTETDALLIDYHMDEGSDSDTNYSSTRPRPSNAMSMNQLTSDDELIIGSASNSYNAEGKWFLNITFCI